MRFIGKFALGGFGIVVVLTCTIFGVVAVQNAFAVNNGFGSGPGDLRWMLGSSFLFGLFGAVGGAVLALIALVVQRFSSRPPDLAAPVPADDGTIWPPPAEPMPAEDPGTVPKSLP